MFESRDGISDEDRLVHHDLEKNVVSTFVHVDDSLANLGQLGTDLVDDLDRIGAWLPVDGYVDLPATVDTDHIRLDRLCVFRIGYIPEKDRFSIDDLDQQIIEFGDLIDHCIGRDHVIQIA